MCGRHTSRVRDMLRTEDPNLVFKLRRMERASNPPISELETADFSAIRKKKCSHLSALSFGSTVKVVQREMCGRCMYIMSASLAGEPKRSI